MATGRPARPLLDANRVIRAADAQLTALHLLEMALETQIRVARGEHFGVHRAVRAVAGSAALMHRFVLEHIGAALRRVTVQTSAILRPQGCAAAAMGESLVRRVTFGATHLAFG